MAQPRSAPVAPSAGRIARVELEMGRLLRSLRDHQLYLRLGFARLGDYVAERLGLSLRTAQELIRVEEALARLPQTSRSYLAGEITASHVRLLSRLATMDDEELWLARARRMDVRALGRAVAAALERDAGGTQDDGSPDPSTGRGVDHDAEDEAELVPLSLRGPAWMLRWWRDTVAFVRRLAGSALPPGAALEVVLAESADVAAGCRGGWLPIGRGSARMGPTEAGGEERATESGTPDTGSPACSSAAVGGRVAAPPDAAGANRARKLLMKDPAFAARQVDLWLRELVGARQRAEAELADRLVCLRASRGYELEGFSSLKAYALRRLGLSLRQMHYLLSLHRTLERLPDLRRAFLMGRLTLRQALFVGRVATIDTTTSWVRRAERVTLRRLEDEVSYSALLREERPEVWELLRGGPLPEGVVLVPGQGARVQVSASDSSPASVRSANSTVVAGGVHGSVSGSAPEDGGGTDHQMHELQMDIERLNRSVMNSNSAADEVAGSEMEASGSLAGGAAGSVAETGGVHGIAPGVAIDARTFICALEASERTTPLPQRRCSIRMRVEPGVRRQWDETIASMRSMSDEPLEEWEAFALILQRFWKVWDNRETRKQRRLHPTVERDGGRCTAPGCRSVGSGRLHEHHIVFRSAGGAVKDKANITTLCTTHHGHLLHAGIIRCRGSAPDDLNWELGVWRTRRPFLTFHGDRRTGGTAM